MNTRNVIDQLLNSSEPPVRYLCRREVLGGDPASDPMLALQDQIRVSERVRKMLNPRGADGRFPLHAYTKWIGRLSDPRCREALDLLETKQLPGGGFRAEVKYYRVTDKTGGSGISFVDWGGVSKNKMNEWLTVAALSVLKQS